MCPLLQQDIEDDQGRVDDLKHRDDDISAKKTQEVVQKK